MIEHGFEIKVTTFESDIDQNTFNYSLPTKLASVRLRLFAQKYKAHSGGSYSHALGPKPRTALLNESAGQPENPLAGVKVGDVLNLSALASVRQTSTGQRRRRHQCLI
jgi:hypothetical protein